MKSCKIIQKITIFTLITLTIVTSTASETSNSSPSKLWDEMPKWKRLYNDDCLVDNRVNSDMPGLSESSLIKPEEYADLDITSFNQALKLQTSISIFKFKNSGKIVSCFFFALALSIVFLVGLYVVACKKIKKKIVTSKQKFSAITVALGLFAFVLLILYFMNISNGTKAKRAEDNILCESFRLPNTFLMGNIETRLRLARQKHFIGIIKLKEWVQHFRDNLPQFLSQKNYSSLQYIDQINLQSHVNEFERALDNYQKKYEDETVPNFAGVDQIPPTISRSLRHFRDLMLKLTTTYSEHVDRIQGLVDIFDFIKDTQSQADFDTNLKSAQDELEHIQAKFVDAWDKLMDFVLVAPGTQSVDVNTILGLHGVILFLILGLMVVFLVKRYQGRALKVRVFRKGLLVLMILLIMGFFMTMTMLFNVYTTHYGCAFLYRITKRDKTVFNYLPTRYKNNRQIKLIIDKCIMPNNDTDQLFSLITNNEQSFALNAYLDFLEGLKLVNDDKQAINSKTDSYSVVAFGNHLEKAKKGYEIEFKELRDKLQQLNQMFMCSDTFYSWSFYTCSMTHTAKQNCIRLDQDHFYHEDCVEDIDAAREIFKALKRHFVEEVDLVTKMQNDLKGNDFSLLTHLQVIWRLNDSIYTKVEVFKEVLKTHFEDFDDGRLENWLDCSVIQEDLEVMFQDTCLNHLKPSITFAKLSVWIGLSLFVLLIWGFVMTLVRFGKPAGDLKDPSEAAGEGKDEKGLKNIEYKKQVDVERFSPMDIYSKKNVENSEIQNSEQMDSVSKESFGLDITEENEKDAPKSMHALGKQQIIPTSRGKDVQNVQVSDEEVAEVKDLEK